MANLELPVNKDIVIPEVKHFKGPTCEQFEPNFLRVFSFAESLRNIVIDGSITNNDGLVIARLYDEQEVFGFQRQIKGNISNRSVQPLLIKNPNQINDSEGKVGVRNGLTVFANIAFAVKIGSLGNYITRPVVPELQNLFVERFNTLINL